MKCTLGDFEIFYEARGAGRPIVMLPGRPSDHSVMQRFMEPLFTQRDGWLRLYPDLPGTGLSPSVERLASHDQMLEAVLAFIDAVIPSQRFVLAGYSYGGYLARGVVSRRAASIDGVLLCAPQVKADLSQTRLPPRAQLVENPGLLARLEPDVAELIEELVVVQSPEVAEEVREVLAEVKKADHPFNARLEVVNSSSFEAHTPPAPFHGPALIVTARQDHVCGYRDAWDLLDSYPRATFAVLDQAGHFVVIEQDELCHALMREWLARIEEGEQP